MKHAIDIILACFTRPTRLERTDTFGMDLLVRQMGEKDIPTAMQLKAFANWNQTETDWRIFLAANPEGCFVAVCDGRVVGTTTVIRYGQSLAWIGMVLVHPDYRGRGIATRLMGKALDHLVDCPTVKLDATAAGKPVYEKLGFVKESVVQRLTTKCLTPIEETADAIVPVARDDLESIARMDRRCFRGDRAFLLAALRENAPEKALHLTCQGRTTGYCLGRQGSKFFQVGPVLAENFLGAISLICIVFSQLIGTDVVIDVPAIHTELLQWLQNTSFSVQREFVRMVRGEKDPDNVMKHQYAICGPEFG